MSTSEKEPEREPVNDNRQYEEFPTVQDILNYQGDVATEMFDFQGMLVRASLQQAQDWRSLAECFDLQKRRAMKMVEICGWIARKSADGIGDITSQFNLDDDAVYEGDDYPDPEEDDDDSV